MPARAESPPLPVPSETKFGNQLRVEGFLMRLNQKPKQRRKAFANAPRTHEGGPAYPEVSKEQELTRSVMSCLLWEDTFYEKGESIADRISVLARDVRPKFLADLAVRARKEYKLRHAPLLLLDGLCETGSGDPSGLVRKTITKTINRPDEISELISVYWRNGRKPLPNQMKKGLRAAFSKFDDFQLSKYGKTKGVNVSLRDVMRMTHPKPDEEHDKVFKKLAKGETRVKGTWEADLSAGTEKKSKADKREIWTEKLKSGKLGYLALLRNLRNMSEAGVSDELVNSAIVARKGAKMVLPFRFVAAYNAAPQYAKALNKAFVAQVSEIEADKEKTVVLVDVSWSMFGGKLSGKSDLDRIDAACALALMVPGKRRIFVFSNEIKEVKDAKGLEDIQRIKHGVQNGGTSLGAAVDYLNRSVKHDRLIVLTDEQSHDYVDAPKGRGYMINVASYKNGVGYGEWVHIDGFSEQVLKFIAAYESEF